MIITFKTTTLSRFAKLLRTVSQIFYIISLVLLFISFFLFAWMWVYAFMHDYVPETPWGIKIGNHGPWRHSYNLRNAFWYIFVMQFLSICLTIVSFIIKPNRKAVILFGIALVVFFMFFYTHYWLVD